MDMNICAIRRGFRTFSGSTDGMVDTCAELIAESPIAR
jgi:hypothetical protein